jgi:hypothetical protein
MSIDTVLDMIGPRLGWGKKAGVVVADARGCQKIGRSQQQSAIQWSRFMVTAADLELLNYIGMDLRFESIPILLLSGSDTPCFTEISVNRLRLLFDAF